MSISGLMADSVLREEVGIAVELIDESQDISGILNSQTNCPISSDALKKANSNEIAPPCDPSFSPNSTGVTNTSVIRLRDIVRDSQARCPNCRLGGSRLGPNDYDELQRRRMNDARRYGRRDRTDWSTANEIPPRYMHTTLPGLTLFYGDSIIGDDLRKVHDQIRHPIDNCKIRDEARFISAANLRLASEAAGVGDYEEAKAFLKIAKDLADFATGVVPGISEVRDAYEFFTGKDAFTGEKLSATSRTLAALGMIPFFGGALKGGKALGKLAALAGRKFPGIYKGMAAVADRAGKLAQKVGKWNPCNAVSGVPCRPFQLPMKHIVDGNISESGKIIGGLHTKGSLLNYFKKNPEIFKDAKNIPNPTNNGVTRWELPRRAFEGRPPPSRAKTLFPESRSPEKIADAANTIIGSRDISKLPNPTIGVFDGVKIKIGVKDGKITTVFPDWPQ